MFAKFEFKPKTSPFNSYKTKEGKSTFKKVFGKNRSEKMGELDDDDVENHASDIGESDRQNNAIVVQDSESDEELLKSAFEDDDSVTKNADQQSSNKGIKLERQHVQ